MFNAVDYVKKCLRLFLIVTFAFFQTILALLFVINIRIIHLVQPPYSSKSLWLPCKESPGKVLGTSQSGRKLCARCIVPSMPSETLQEPVEPFWNDTYDCILPPSLPRPQRRYTPLLRLL